ncbi:MAG: hypothetical protein GEU80_11665 [Dehalococcoidia bacterium]|nr:hypothetical protein [Dehalococcoidia bacterium]
MAVPYTVLGHCGVRQDICTGFEPRAERWRARRPRERDGNPLHLVTSIEGERDRAAEFPGCLRLGGGRPDPR